MPGLDDPQGWQFAAACLAAALVGLSKTGVAGVGILMVPLLAWAFPARASTGILLPILVAGDIVALTVYRRQAQWEHVRRCLVWAVLGVLAGWAFYKWIDPSDGHVKRLIGLVVLAVLVLGWWVGRRRATEKNVPNPKAGEEGGDGVEISATSVESISAEFEETEREERVHARPAPYWFAAMIGLTGGFTTMVANAAGPVWIVYMLALGLPKKAFLGTTAWAFFMVNLFKIPFSWDLGLIRLDSLRLNLTMVPGLLLGAGLGLLVLRKMPQTWFNRIASVLAVAAALHLLLGG